MNADTIAIIVAILGVGLALWRAIATIRQDIVDIRRDIDSRHKELRQEIDSRHKESRQDMAALRQELRTDIGALHGRIDALYQALFNHKDPAA